MTPLLSHCSGPVSSCHKIDTVMASAYCSVYWMKPSLMGLAAYQCSRISTTSFILVLFLQMVWGDNSFSTIASLPYPVETFQGFCRWWTARTMQVLAIKPLEETQLLPKAIVYDQVRMEAVSRSNDVSWFSALATEDVMTLVSTTISKEHALLMKPTKSYFLSTRAPQKARSMPFSFWQDMGIATDVTTVWCHVESLFFKPCCSKEQKRQDEYRLHQPKKLIPNYFF